MPTDSKPLQGLSDRYEVLDLLGEGGMGRVYKAQDLTLNRTVAIKVLFGQFAEMNVPRFQREAQTMSALRHKNLVDVYDFGITNSGDAFLVMEYVTGVTMSSIVKQRAPMNVFDVIELCQGIASGMAHAHLRNVVHRDLKPSNILVMNPDDLSGLKILDFGISKALDTSKERDFLTMTGQMIGTPLYMSPEQAEGAQVDPRADIYSLGCIMYECLSGKVPFRGDTALDTVNMHRFTPVVSLNVELPDLQIPPRLDELVLRLLAKKPEERIQTMQQVYDELDAISLELIPGDDPSSAESEKLHEEAPAFAPSKNNNRLIAGFISLAVIILASLAGYLTLYTSQPSAPPANVKRTTDPRPARDRWQNHFEPTRDQNDNIVLNSYRDKVPSGESLTFKGTPISGAHIRLLRSVKVEAIRIEYSELKPDCYDELASLPDLKDLLFKEPARLDPKQLGLIKNLENLRFEDAIKITAEDVRGWSNLKNLRYLTFDKADVNDDTISAVAQTLPWLRSLDVATAEHYLGSSLADVSKLKKLDYLSLSSNRISDSDLKLLSKNHSILTVLLNGNDLVTLKGIRTLLLENPKIKVVGVAKCSQEVRTGVNDLHIRDVIFDGAEKGGKNSIIAPEDLEPTNAILDTLVK